MQSTRMKLNKEQCENLPFPIGCRIWYNIKIDDGLFSGGGVQKAAADHGEAMEKKWGALLGGATGDSASTKNNKPRCYGAFSFSDGVVSAAFLDIIASSIMYEITPARSFRDSSIEKTPEDKLYLEKELLYGHGSPVHINPSHNSNSGVSDEIPGQVLLCRLKQEAPEEPSDAIKTETAKSVRQIKAALDLENSRILRLHKPQTDSLHVTTVIQLLKRLLAVSMDSEILTTTKISASITKMKSYANQEVANLARSLLSKWRTLNQSSELSSNVLSIKQNLERLVDTQTDDRAEEILNALCSLNNINMTLEVLRATGVGMLVAKLKKSKNASISMLAKDCVTKWKVIASNSEEAAPENSRETPRVKKLTAETPTFLYTVKVPLGDGSFHIEEDIAADRVKYRHDNDVSQPVTPSKPEPEPIKPDEMIVEQKGEAKTASHTREDLPDISNTSIDEERCPLASPSTLTHSDTTLDANSQSGSSKRKSTSSDQKGQDSSSKRPCTKTVGGHNWTPPTRTIPDVTLQDSFSSPTQRGQDDTESKNVIKIPLPAELVPRIIGTKGITINGIQKKTGCLIDISPRREDGESPGEVRHAIIRGNTAAVDKAAEMIQNIITGKDKIEEEINPCITIPVHREHISRLIGSNGVIINEIQRKCGCMIEIRGNEAKITGRDSVHIEEAARLIRARINDIEKEDSRADVVIRSLETPPGNVRNAPIGQVNSGGKIMYCNVNFPPWLVYDDSSRARLHREYKVSYHFFPTLLTYGMPVLKDFLQNNQVNLHCIAHSTKCFVEIGSWTAKGVNMPFYDPTYVYIQSNGQDPKSDIRRAKEDIENLLIDYIHQDGSIGRLFYDTAISCTFLHGYINDRSTTVYQRNPFVSGRTYMCINIVELPYERNKATDTKNFHGHFLMTGSLGVLREVRRQTGCTLKICGDAFKVPVKYCDPYVFVYGDKQQDVDEAVLIVTDAIKVKLRNEPSWIWKEDSKQRRHSMMIQRSKESYH